MSDMRKNLIISKASRMHYVKLSDLWIKQMKNL